MELDRRTGLERVAMGGVVPILSVYTPIASGAGDARQVRRLAHVEPHGRPGDGRTQQEHLREERRRRRVSTAPLSAPLSTPLSAATLSVALSAATLEQGRPREEPCREL